MQPGPTNLLLAISFMACATLVSSPCPAEEKSIFDMDWSPTPNAPAAPAQPPKPANPANPNPPALATASTPFEYTSFRWDKGEPIKMIKTTDGFCILTGVCGPFHGQSEAAYLSIGDDGFWYLNGKTRSGFLKVSALAVHPKQGKFEPQIFEWSSGQKPLKLISRDEGFCYLAGISGRFAGGGESARVYADEDGFWYLHGKGHSGKIKAWAVAVKTPLKFDLADFKWIQKTPPILMVPQNEGFPCLTSICGAFEGGGEAVRICPGADNAWYLAAQTRQGFLHVDAQSVKLTVR